MKAYTISSDSTCEEVAETLITNCKLKEEDKNKFIKEGISGDVLLDILLDCEDYQKTFQFKLGSFQKIRKYLEENKEKLKVKEINENISIKTEEDIKIFFEKFIGFKENLKGIKGENELKQLKKEDMEKLGLNLGQRIKLTRYINYFNSLKQKEKEIIISIAKDTNDDDALNYLKKELNISERSIEKLGLDSNISNLLLSLSEDELNHFLTKKEIEKKEYETLKKFIEKRDKMVIQESIKINKNSSEEDISKFIKEKLNFDIDKQDVNELNLDKYGDITKDDKEIIQNFLNQVKSKQNLKSIDKNVIKIGDEEFDIITKDNSLTDFDKKKKYIIKESSKIYYLKKEKESFQKDANHNIFFILSTKKESFSNLRFAVYQKKGIFNISYINYDFYLINVSKYGKKNQRIFLLLFQVASNEPINEFSINVKDLEDNDEKPIYESWEITTKEDENFFVLNIKNVYYDDYFPKIHINSYFTEYLYYFFNDQKDIKNTIKKDLIETLNNKIASTKDNISLSAENTLKFIECCGNFNIRPTKLDIIKIKERDRNIDKRYYISDEFIKKNFRSKEITMISIILLKIFSIYDIEKLLEMINEEKNCKLLFDLMFVLPIQIPSIKLKQEMDKKQIEKLQKNLIKVSKNSKDIQNILNIGDDIESNLNIIYENLKIIIPMIDKEKNSFKGFQWTNPQINDNIPNIYIIYVKINDIFKSLDKENNLLKIKDIFEKMVEVYNNKDNLEDYLSLRNFIDIDENIITSILFLLNLCTKKQLKQVTIITKM